MNLQPTLFLPDRPAGKPVQLRDYQLECLDAIKLGAEKQNRGVVACATGLGKTQIFAHLPEKLGVKHMMVLAHREELLEQAKSKIEIANPDLCVEIEQATKRVSSSVDVVVASVPTIGRSGSARIQKFDPSEWPVIISDECHLSIAPTFRNVFNYFHVFDDPKKLLVGFTATPRRGDNVGLEEVYQDIWFSRDLRWGIENHWLCDIVGYRVKTDVDLSSVKITAGDFQDDQLSDAVDNPARNALAVSAYNDYCRGRRTLIYCVDCEHAYNMADMFEAAGLKCGVVLGETPKEERRDLLVAFHEGTLERLITVNVLSVGWDEPYLSAIIMARPTKSGLFFQQAIGRGTRIAEGKENLVVVDMTDNSRKHQLLSIPVLFGLPPKLNLEGKSVMGAVHLIENAKVKQPRAKLDDITDIGDVKEIIEKFDIWKNAEIDDEVKKYSEFTWIKDGENYSIYIPKEKTLFVIVGNLLGKYDLSCSQEGKGKKLLETFASKWEAFRRGDGIIKTEYANQTPLLSNRARWRESEVTDKQRNLMESLGLPIPDGLTKGQASILIGKRLGR